MSLIRNEERVRLAICVGAPILLGILTGIFNFSPIRSVCKNLHTPPFTAPALLMVLLWFVVYIAIGLATFLVIGSRIYREEKLLGMVTCAGQLLLHSFWIIVFFSGHHLILGCLVHLLYTAAALLNALLYYKIDNRAGLLAASGAVLSIYYMYISIAVIFIN